MASQESEEARRRALDDKRMVDRALRSLDEPMHSPTGPRAADSKGTAVSLLPSSASTLQPAGPTPAELARQLFTFGAEPWKVLASMRAHPAFKNSDARVVECIIDQMKAGGQVMKPAEGCNNLPGMIPAFERLFFHGPRSKTDQDLGIMLIRELVKICNRQCRPGDEYFLPDYMDKTSMTTAARRQALDTKRAIDSALRSMPASSAAPGTAATPAELARGLRAEKAEPFKILHALRTHPACRGSHARAFEVLIEELTLQGKVTRNAAGHINGRSLVRAIKHVFLDNISQHDLIEPVLMLARELVKVCNQQCRPGVVEMLDDDFEDDSGVQEIPADLPAAIEDIVLECNQAFSSHKEELAYMLRAAACQTGWQSLPGSDQRCAGLFIATQALAPGMDSPGLWNMTTALRAACRAEKMAERGAGTEEQVDADVQRIMTDFLLTKRTAVYPREQGVMLAAELVSRTPEQARADLITILKGVDPEMRYQVASACAVALYQRGHTELSDFLTKMMPLHEQNVLLNHARHFLNVETLLNWLRSPAANLAGEDAVLRQALDQKRAIDRCLQTPFPAITHEAATPTRCDSKLFTGPASPTPADIAGHLFDDAHQPYAVLANLRKHPACQHADERVIEVLLEEIRRQGKGTHTNAGHLKPRALIRVFKNLFFEKIPLETPIKDVLFMARGMVSICNKYCHPDRVDGLEDDAALPDSARPVPMDVPTALEDLVLDNFAYFSIEDKRRLGFLMRAAAWQDGYSAVPDWDGTLDDLTGHLKSFAPGMDDFALWNMALKLPQAAVADILAIDSSLDSEQVETAAQENVIDALMKGSTLAPRELGVMLAAIISQCDIAAAKNGLAQARNFLTRSQLPAFTHACIHTLRGHGHDELASALEGRAPARGHAGLITPPPHAAAGAALGVPPGLQPGQLAATHVPAGLSAPTGAQGVLHADNKGNQVASGRGWELVAALRDSSILGRTPLSRAQYEAELERLCKFDRQLLPEGRRGVADVLQLDAIAALLHSNHAWLTEGQYQRALALACRILGSCGSPDVVRSAPDSAHRKQVLGMFNDLLQVLFKVKAREISGTAAPSFVTAAFLQKLPDTLGLVDLLSAAEFKRIHDGLTMLATSPATSLPTELTRVTAMTTAAPTRRDTPATTSASTAAHTGPRLDQLLSLSMTPEEQEAVRARYFAAQGAGRGAQAER